MSSSNLGITKGEGEEPKEGKEGKDAAALTLSIKHEHIRAVAYPENLKIVVQFMESSKGCYQMRMSNAHIGGREIAMLEELPSLFASFTGRLEICMSNPRQTGIFSSRRSFINANFSPEIWDLLHLRKPLFENCNLAIGADAHGMLIDNCESEFATKFLELFSNFRIDIRVKIAQCFEFANLAKFIRKITPIEGCKELSMGRGVCSVNAYTPELCAWLHRNSGRKLFFETRFENPHHVDMLLDRVKKVFAEAKHRCEFTMIYMWDDYEPYEMNWSEEQWDKFYENETMVFKEFTMNNVVTGETLSLKRGHYGGGLRIGEFTLKRAKMNDKEEEDAVEQRGGDGKAWTSFDIGR